MRPESTLSRSLWAIVLTIAVAIIVVSYARQTLGGGDDEASGFGPTLTLWVAGAGADGESMTVATQAASCWEMNGHPATVGILPGGSTIAVGEFLDGVRGKPDELLLITSTTLSDIARDRRDPLLSAESHERAAQAQRLLGQAVPVAILASDPLALAVPANSSIHTSAELLAQLRSEPSRRVFDVAADSWVRGHLAMLVRGAGLHGETPYGVFRSPQEALASLDAGEGEVAVAPRSAIESQLHTDRLREVAWPAASGLTPHAWIAILAPDGLGRSAVSALRTQARGLCAGTTWSQLLRGDGLTPVAPSTNGLQRFMPDSIGEATRLQEVASQVIRGYATH